MSSLPITQKTNDQGVTEFFDKYFTKKISYPSNEVDAVVAFFKKRGFDEEAAISTATVVLQQAKLDEIKVFTLLDTLSGFDNVKLSGIVTEILNYNRLSTSTLGFRKTNLGNKTEKRNILY